MTGAALVALVALPVVFAILEVARATRALAATVLRSAFVLTREAGMTVRVEGADEVARLVAKSGALLLAVKSEDTSMLSDEIAEAAAELDVEFEAWRQQ